MDAGRLPLLSVAVPAACRLPQDDVPHGLLGGGDGGRHEDVLGRGGGPPGGPVAVAAVRAGGGGSLDSRPGPRRKVRTRAREQRRGYEMNANSSSGARVSQSKEALFVVSMGKCMCV